MLDYHALMVRAVAKLDRNTAEDRQALFDGARALLVTQLRNRRPPAMEPEIKREQIALEEAIRKVELELVTAVIHSPSSATAVGRERNVAPPPFTNGPGLGRTPMLEGESQVDAFTPADPVTFMLITTQMWLDHLVTDAKLPIASEGLKKDLDTVLQWLEVKKPDDIGTKEHQQWAAGFEQYLREGKVPSPLLARSFNFFREQVQAIKRTSPQLGKPITDDMRAVYGQMLAFDEDITLPRVEKKPAPPPPPPLQPEASVKPTRPNADFLLVPDRADSAIKPPASKPSANKTSGFKVPEIKTPAIKGILGFLAGFVLVFGLEALLFGRTGGLSGYSSRGIGLGWLVMPIAAGCGGWVVFRDVDLVKGALKQLVAEFRSWPRDHQVALVVTFAIGWIVGVVLGFFVSILGRPDYDPPTFATWALGSSVYFPLASLASGFAGGLVGAAIIYVQQLLRSGEASGQRGRQDVAVKVERAKTDASTSPVPSPAVPRPPASTSPTPTSSAPTPPAPTPPAPAPPAQSGPRAPNAPPTGLTPAFQPPPGR